MASLVYKTLSPPDEECRLLKGGACHTFLAEPKTTSIINQASIILWPFFVCLLKLGIHGAILHAVLG